MRSRQRLGMVLASALCSMATVHLSGQDVDSSAAEGARWSSTCGGAAGRFCGLDAARVLADRAGAGERQSRKLREAEAAFQAALREFEDYPGALLGLGATQLARHRFAEARSLAERVLQRAPRNVDARLLLRMREWLLGELEAAAQVLEGMEESPAVLSRRAELARLRGGNDEAIRLHLRAAEAAEARGEGAEQVAWHRVRLGEMLFRTGKLTQADEAISTRGAAPARKFRGGRTPGGTARGAGKIRRGGSVVSKDHRAIAAPGHGAGAGRFVCLYEATRTGEDVLRQGAGGLSRIRGDGARCISFIISRASIPTRRRMAWKR